MGSQPDILLKCPNIYPRLELSPVSFLYLPRLSSHNNSGSYDKVERLLKVIINTNNPMHLFGFRIWIFFGKLI